MTRSTPPRDVSRKITVCDRCLTAACWHGVFECRDSLVGATTTLTVAELDRLGREHPSHYLAQRERVG